MSKTSDAVYAGQTAKNGDDIQLRGTSPAGIVSTTSGGKIKSVVIEWSSSATNSRTIDVYGKSTVYSTAKDLYSTKTAGTKAGSITYTSKTSYATTYNFDKDYEYVGIRMTSSATRIKSISITWASADACSADPTVAAGQLKGSVNLTQLRPIFHAIIR